MATTPYPFVAGAVLTASQLNSTFNVPINAQTASYVLVASDAGKRVQMNAAGATTITVNTSLFSAGDSLFIQNIGAGTCTITAGTATVTTAGSLALAQWGGGTLYFTSASAAIFFSGGGATYGTATGGSSSSITVGGVNYTLLTFTTDGTLTVTKAGLFDWYAIGGGGSGGDNGRGGGAGGMHTTGTAYLSTNQSITVSAGSARHTITGSQQTFRNGLFSGVSSGFIAMSGAIGSDPNGGTGLMGGGSGGNYTGGAGTAGAAGTTVTFAGGSTVLGGGGGGGGTTGGAGGSGGGGAGGGGAAAGTAGTANTGGGGGGGGASGGNGGIGGSGIVYVRFKV